METSRTPEKLREFFYILCNHRIYLRPISDYTSFNLIFKIVTTMRNGFTIRATEEEFTGLVTLYAVATFMYQFMV